LYNDEGGVWKDLNRVEVLETRRGMFAGILDTRSGKVAEGSDYGCGNDFATALLVYLKNRNKVSVIERPIHFLIE